MPKNKKYNFVCSECNWEWHSNVINFTKKDEKEHDKMHGKRERE